jgi:hypothetical protein
MPSVIRRTHSACAGKAKHADNVKHHHTLFNVAPGATA